MELPKTDPDTLRRIYVLEAAAREHLANPQDTFTIITYRIPLQEQAMDLMFESRSEGGEDGQPLTSLDTSAFLYKQLAGPHQRVLRQTVACSSIQDAPEVRMLTGKPLASVIGLRRARFSSELERKAAWSVHSLWSVIRMMPDIREYYSLDLRSYAHLGKLATNMMGIALPLLSQGALYTTQSTEVPGNDGMLRFEAHTFSGNPRHADHRYIGMPLLRASIDIGDTRYVYERTSEGDEETRRYPNNPAKRFEGFTGYVPELDSWGKEVPFPVRTADIKAFEAQERAAGKYEPDSTILDALLTNIIN